MWSLYTAFQIVVIVTLGRCIYLRYFHPLSRYPGPFIASFTNLWRFFSFQGGQHHLAEQKLHGRYGPVIRTGPSSLSFASLPAFEAIYGFNRSFEKGDFYSFGRDARTKAGSIFDARTDAIHCERRRKVVGPALSVTKVATYEPIISKHVSNLLSRIAEAKSLVANNSAVNVALCVHRYTFDTMVDTIYGPISPQPYTSTPASRDVLKGFQDMSKLAWGASYLPWFGWLMSTRPMVYLIRLPTYDSSGSLTSIAALVARARTLVFTDPSLALQSRHPSILQNYLQVPSSDPKHMASDEIWRECFNLTFAGPGSTAAALTSILYTLGTPRGHPWQSRILADTGDETSPILVAVIKETLRLHAPFPTAFPRTITPGAESAIPNLPAPLPVGTLVSANTYVIGHSKEIWGPDVEEWKPERWLGDEAERKKAEEGFVVFSKGPRGCVGREIAMMTLAKAVRGVLRRWDVRAEGPMSGKSFLEMQYHECKLAFEEREKG